MLADKLKDAGLKIYTTAEPTNSRIGLMIRDIFRHKMEADHRTIAALYAADRLEHLLNKTDGILKKMEEGLYCYYRPLLFFFLRISWCAHGYGLGDPGKFFECRPASAGSQYLY